MGAAAPCHVNQSRCNKPQTCPIAELRCLELRRNHFRRLPPAISTASALTRLRILENDELVLGEADLGTLLALPCLRCLELDRVETADPALLQQLQLRMPHLRIVPVSRW